MPYFRSGSIRARWAKEDRSFVVCGRPATAVGQLFPTLLTLMAALAAGLAVGLVALTRRTPSGGGRLLTLHCYQSAVFEA